MEVYGAVVVPEAKGPAELPRRLNHWIGLVRTHIELGRMLTAAGKHDEAQAAYREALRLVQVLPAVHQALWRLREVLITLYPRSNLNPDLHTDQAMQRVWDALRLVQDSPALLEAEVRCHMAVAFAELGNAAEATAALRSAQELVEREETDAAASVGIL